MPARPVVLTAWVYSTYSIVDGIFIGRYVGSEGLAALNLLLPLLYVPYAFSILIGVGGSTLVARLLGERREREAAATFTQALWLVLLIGGSFTVLYWFGAAPLVRLLGAEGELATLAEAYLLTSAGFVVFATAGYALEMFLRVEGAAKYGLYCMLAGAVVNIGLDYLLIARWGWGMNGAALATGLSQLIAASLMLAFHLFRARLLRPVRRALSIGNQMGRMVYNGSSEFLAEMAPAVTILAFNWVILHHLGQDGLVAYAVLEYLTLAAVVTMVALVQSMQPLISFHVGARCAASVQAVFRIGLASVLGCALLSVGAMLTLSDWLAALFLPDSANAQRFLGDAVLWYALAFVPAAINLTVAGYFTAIEAPGCSALIAVLRSWLLLLGLLWLLTVWLGAGGVWYVLLSTELITLAVSLWLYRGHPAARAVV
ncbi:MATE family efflux transporter [Neisseriaceae bacterium JH1-16]|nr:MATE family efflux transporter [Neisseriaceae bacterium JH1-16]